MFLCFFYLPSAVFFTISRLLPNLTSKTITASAGTAAAHKLIKSLNTKLVEQRNALAATGKALYATEVEINDYPQMARSKVTHKVCWMVPLSINESECREFF